MFDMEDFQRYGKWGIRKISITIKESQNKNDIIWRSIMHGEKLRSEIIILNQNRVHSYKRLNFKESIFNDTGLGSVFVDLDGMTTNI